VSSAEGKRRGEMLNKIIPAAELWEMKLPGISLMIYFVVSEYLH